MHFGALIVVISVAVGFNVGATPTTGTINPFGNKGAVKLTVVKKDSKKLTQQESPESQVLD
jgi:hypothetical protein